jgi:hypothetical protein
MYVTKKNVIWSTSTFGGRLHGYLSWLVGASTHQQQNVDVFRIAQNFAGACVSANGAQKFQAYMPFLPFFCRGGVRGAAQSRANGWCYACHS